jgi:hypothetical protein
LSTAGAAAAVALALVGLRKRRIDEITEREGD